MKTFFEDIFEYSHHSNQLVISALQDNPSLFKDRVSALISHTLNAHHIWNHRITGASPILSVWGALPLNQLRDIETANFQKSLQIIDKKELGKKINYHNSTGHAFTNTVAEILFHIINHSTYHRGQLMSLLKEEGLPPLVTDYIFYKR